MAIVYNTSVVRSGLVLHLDAANPKSYPGSGTTWTDLSGNGNHATLYNSPTFSNGGLVLSGTNQYATIPYNSVINSSTTFTLDIFLKYGASAEMMVFSNSSSSGSAKGWHTEIYGNKTIMQVYPSGTYTSATNALTVNNTYCYTLTYNAGSVSYYLNGVANGTGSYTFTPSTADIMIGAWAYGGTPAYFFNGSIYSIKFYTRALTAAEIQQNFEALRGRYGI